MGGASTEIGRRGTIDILLEAANWDPSSSPGPPAGTSCRARRRSDSSGRSTRSCRRWRGARRTAARRARRGHDRGRAAPTPVPPTPPAPVRMPMELPDRVAGVAYERGATVRRLSRSAATSSSRRRPTARVGRRHPAVLAARSRAARRPGGGGAAPARATTPSRRSCPRPRPGAASPRPSCAAARSSRALAETGNVEVLPFPFVVRRSGTRSAWPPTTSAAAPCTVLNPLDADRPELATTLLPGLLDVLVRNGPAASPTCPVHTVEQVVLPHAKPVAMPDPDVADRPTDAEVAQIKAALPAQPVHVAACSPATVSGGAGGVRGGRPGGRTRSRSAGSVGAAAGVELRVTHGVAAAVAPGTVRRAARRRLDRRSRRRAAPEGRRGARLPRAPARWRSTSTRCPARGPPGPAGVALSAGLGGRRARGGADVPAAELTEALRTAVATSSRRCGSSTSTRVIRSGTGIARWRSRLRFRAPDRTLTNEEANAARDAAVAVAADRFGAALR